MSRVMDRLPSAMVKGFEGLRQRMLNRKSDRVVAEVFLAGKENSNSSGKDSHEKTRK